MSCHPRAASTQFAASLIPLLSSLLAQQASATALLCKGYGWTEIGAKREYATVFQYDALTLRASISTFHGKSVGDLKKMMTRVSATWRVRMDERTLYHWTGTQAYSV